MACHHTVSGRQWHEVTLINLCGPTCHVTLSTVHCAGLHQHLSQTYLSPCRCIVHTVHCVLFSTHRPTCHPPMLMYCTLCWPPHTSQLCALHLHCHRPSCHPPYVSVLCWPPPTCEMCPSPTLSQIGFAYAYIHRPMR